jgi:hypothetical protein
MFVYIGRPNMRRYCVLTTYNVSSVAVSIMMMCIGEDEFRRRRGLLCGEISGQ